MTASPSPPVKRSLSRADSFRHAFAGWWYVLRTQRNAWIHSAFTLAVVGVGLWLGLRPVEWAILVLAMGLVWTAELINTALEAAIDLASPEIHPLAKVGKDVAAAAVLGGAVTAVIVGLLILGPPLFSRLWPFVTVLSGR
ncbi:MAG TPA: diacylglycerol kinase family protein [Chloroflexi bacterium]|nr:diacylglycerol kinase family protein [Chloroflexota bacterium]